MEFEKVIRTELEKLLNTHGFKITMVDNHSMKFQSAKLTLKFIYNPREISFGYWMKHMDSATEYENWVVEKLSGPWNMTVQGTFLFRDDNDAALFKMTWFG